MTRYSPSIRRPDLVDVFSGASSKLDGAPEITPTFLSKLAPGLALKGARKPMASRLMPDNPPEASPLPMTRASS